MPKCKFKSLNSNFRKKKNKVRKETKDHQPSSKFFNKGSREILLNIPLNL